MSRGKRLTTAIAPGQVWWCDGAGLGFEWRFKTRPVLVVAPGEEGNWLVMPLSSKRSFGQEPMVTHGAKVSYMTGRRAIVPAAALVSYSGDWSGFSAWRDEATQHAPFSLLGFLRDWLRRLFR